MDIGDGWEGRKKQKGYRCALRYDIALSEHVSLLTLPSDGVEGQMQ